jgi:hypothetical protein
MPQPQSVRKFSHDRDGFDEGDSLGWADGDSLGLSDGMALGDSEGMALIVKDRDQNYLSR